MTKKKRKKADGHNGRMCSVTCCSCHMDVEELKRLVRRPKYVCRQCGRVARKKRLLCEPISLK